MTYIEDTKPCLNCKERRIVELNGKQVTCHSICHKYQEWINDMNGIKADEKLEKEKALNGIHTRTKRR